MSVIWRPLGLGTSFRALKDFLTLAAVEGLSSCFFVSLNPMVLRSSYRKLTYTEERAAVGRPGNSGGTGEPGSQIVF